MSKVEVNQISSQCGSTLTIGQSGDTVTLACGATQSGFGRTGTVDWQTTPKTANFTAVNGEGYFCNTTSSSFTMTMPSGSAGAIVAIQDYNNTFDTNNLTVTPASGEKINGGVDSASLSVSTEGQGITFVYVDSTVGWKTIHENKFTAGGVVNLTATGGTVTTCGNYKIHTFTSPGTFCVSQIATATENNTVSYMVVAGGGAGGVSSVSGGGGGAGGFREYKGPADCYSSSPLDGNPGGTAITVTATGYPITVGGGGAGGPTTPPISCAAGNSGSNSVFSTITSAGGGGGSAYGCTPANAAKNGGSGGGGHGAQPTVPGGTGNTPPVSPPQGNNGGAGGNNPSTYANAGGGGGATAVGETISGNFPGGGPGGDGGAGATTSILGSPTAYAGGGGGGADNRAASLTGGDGGSGGGGNGGDTTRVTTSGTTNTGGGGGGHHGPCNSCGSGSGGSGIVIIRYKYQ